MQKKVVIGITSNLFCVSRKSVCESQKNFWVKCLFHLHLLMIPESMQLLLSDQVFKTSRFLPSSD